MIGVGTSSGARQTRCSCRATSRPGVSDVEFGIIGLSWVNTGIAATDRATRNEQIFISIIWLYKHCEWVRDK